MKRFTWALLVSVAFVLAACGSNQASCQKIFEENYETNLQRFVDQQIETGVSPELARKRGEYVLNKAFEIDSTFVKLSPTQMDVWLGAHMSDFIDGLRDIR